MLGRASSNACRIRLAVTVLVCEMPGRWLARNGEAVTGIRDHVDVEVEVGPGRECRPGLPLTTEPSRIGPHHQVSRIVRMPTHEIFSYDLVCGAIV